MNKVFWKGKRVLLTGHTGFKGSWLTLWLQSMGAEVTGYALPAPTNPNLFELARASEGIRTVTGDVRDFDSLSRTVAETNPEIVFHLAAQSVVRYSYENPLETYATNVMGTANLLEAMRQLKSRCAVVNVTSDKCYENRQWEWGYRETDRLGGHDPYSNSKACSELVTAAFRHSYFNSTQADGRAVEIATARAGNVVGGGDWTQDQLVPDIIRAFLNDRPVFIRSPHAIRPWQFVLEPLRGYMTLAEHLWREGSRYAEGWNFGPLDDDAQPVSAIVKALSELWGPGARWQQDEGPHPYEARLLKLDISKAQTKLVWSPRIGLAQTLQWTVEWYRAFAAGKDIREVSLDQISRYEALLAGGSVHNAE